MSEDAIATNSVLLTARKYSIFMGRANAQGRGSLPPGLTLTGERSKGFAGNYHIIRFPAEFET